MQAAILLGNFEYRLQTEFAGYRKVDVDGLSLLSIADT